MILILVNYQLRTHLARDGVAILVLMAFHSRCVSGMPVNFHLKKVVTMMGLVQITFNYFRVLLVNLILCNQKINLG